jgi:hypothetical protein
VALGLEVSIGLSGFSSLAAFAGMIPSKITHSARKAATRQGLGTKINRFIMIHKG